MYRTDNQTSSVFSAKAQLGDQVTADALGAVSCKLNNFW
jgi:hypothetical protein